MNKLQEKTSKMIIKQQDILSTAQPRTANLLACRQWWKVCFLHGNQEKYYREIYGKAAAQRLALAHQNSAQSSVTSTPTFIHPIKESQQELRRRHRKFTFNKEPIIPHSRVTVLDDPFLFGIENDGCGSDSGIDTNPRSKNNKVPLIDPKPILKSRFPSKPKNIPSKEAATCISSPEGSPQNIARSRNGIVEISEAFCQEATSEQSLQIQHETSEKINNKQVFIRYNNIAG